MAMPVVDPHRRWTAAEVRRLVDENPFVTPRYELVDGELLVTPSPREPHQGAVVQLLVALHAYVEEHRLGRVLTSPSDVELEPEFLAQPDVFVVPPDAWRQARAGRRVLRELMLVVEVLSPSSSRHDRVRKRPKYQQHVPEYWIVDLDARLFERWRPGDERPEILTLAIEWHPAGAPVPFRLDLERYFARLLDED